MTVPHFLRRGLRFFAVLALVTLAAACTGLGAPQVDNVAVHELAPTSHPPSAPPPSTDVVIEVAPPRAWPGFDTTQMVYVRQPYELEHFATSRWVDTPSRMIAPLLVRTLEQSGNYRTVVQTSSSVQATYRLDTEIVRLLQDFSARPSRIVLVIRVQVTDMRAKRVIATRLFEDVEESPAENAAGGVTAANAALRRVLGQIAYFCAESTHR